MSPRNELEEWLTELPPLDGADDEPDENEAVPDDFVPDDRGDASLDDAAADDLEVDEGVEITEEESDSKDDEQWQADVGEPELDITEGEPSALDDAVADPSDDVVGGRASPVDESDLDIDENLPTSDDDAGEEGTNDPIEHSLEEDLPALDADDEGDFEDTLLLEVRIPAGAPSSIRWADALWEERSGLERALAWPIGDDDAVTGACLAVTAASEIVAAVTERSALLVRARDTAAVATPPGEQGPWILALSAGAHPVLWAASRAGELAKSVDLGASWTRGVGLGRAILAVGARDDGTLSVLARKGDTVELSTSTDGTRWFSQRIGVELQVDHGRALFVAHRGVCTAIGDAGGIAISRDGRRFTRVPVAGATAGAFAGRTADAPLVVAGTFENEDAIQLVRIPRDGDVEIIGEVRAPVSDDEPKVLALAWHDATETLRIAFATHLVSWGPAKKARG
jgi:hypothetical protein